MPPRASRSHPHLESGPSASDGELGEPLGRQAAHLCRLAGADETLIPQWTGEGRTGPGSPARGRTGALTSRHRPNGPACPPAGTGAAGTARECQGSEGYRWTARACWRCVWWRRRRPGMAVRTCRAYRGRGGEREGGVDLCGGQGQRPFLVVGDAAEAARPAPAAGFPRRGRTGGCRARPRPVPAPAGPQYPDASGRTGPV